MIRSVTMRTHAGQKGIKKTKKNDFEGDDHVKASSIIEQHSLLVFSDGRQPTKIIRTVSRITCNVEPGDQTK